MAVTSPPWPATGPSAGEARSSSPSERRALPARADSTGPTSASGPERPSVSCCSSEASRHLCTAAARAECGRGRSRSRPPTRYRPGRFLLTAPVGRGAGSILRRVPSPPTITPVFVADLLADDERMPLYVHVIDHSDARVLVDTGMTELHAAVADLDPRLRPLSEHFDLDGIDIV